MQGFDTFNVISLNLKYDQVNNHVAMKSYDELLVIKHRFKPHLEQMHYAFIAPSDPIIYSLFLAMVNELPAKNGSYDEVLADEKVIKKLILKLDPNTALDIYIRSSRLNSNELFHHTLEEYISKNKIVFNY